MTGHNKLIVIKSIHTVIWCVFNVIIFYFLYAVIADRIDVKAWICLALIIAEGLILYAFGNQCPLTVLARKYSSRQEPNFDIYLPNWLARYNKPIYISIVMLGIIVLAYRLFIHT